jgi:hypothetical protein
VLRPCCITGASFIPSTRCRARPSFALLLIQ